MIGLKRYTVRVVEHEPRWAALAADVCRDAARVCGDLLIDIQHVGSTAVPGLSAKPILDFAAGVITLDVVPELGRRLTGTGYIDRGNSGDEGGHLFVKECAPAVRTIHFHVVQYNGVQWLNYLAFRGLLRGNSALCKEYAELKHELERRFQQDRASYTESKRAFIGEALSRVQTVGVSDDTGVVGAKFSMSFRRS